MQAADEVDALQSASEEETEGKDLSEEQHIKKVISSLLSRSEACDSTIAKDLNEAKYLIQVLLGKWEQSRRHALDLEAKLQSSNLESDLYKKSFEICRVSLEKQEDVSHQIDATNLIFKTQESLENTSKELKEFQKESRQKHKEMAELREELSVLESSLISTKLQAARHQEMIENYRLVLFYYSEQLERFDASLLVDINDEKTIQSLSESGRPSLPDVSSRRRTKGKSGLAKLQNYFMRLKKKRSVQGSFNDGEETEEQVEMERRKDSETIED